ncbi:MAG: bifunctional diaminohydroxyphosphoribosylaminopyrimidine deaminase/5-amino-6-(5-phosphoribosylamino)uracil reductase RibD [Thermoanaerobaculia bacterium]|nr:bifunctional diaminohydroxyphosphoribosylaminopyrimidine deaminase/5-amino-6-(5-phosphoribosylamino)uracil reductase RibD [Thermoanaerobaculia bacterium]
MLDAPQYILRCFQLARLGAGSVSPNPMVGAVLVYDGRIIGEGWHRRYGEAHAEVNAVRAVAQADRPLIPQATLYCSLEPCFHHGKTPPCVDLILEQKIPRVVISNTDPNPLVAGQSIQKLRNAGVEVTTNILEAEGQYLNRAFFTWILKKRPYVVLKWAQSDDGFIARTGEQTAISGPLVQRLLHRWRSESDAILVGTTTALTDNPRLDNRRYFGRSPLRVALDFKAKIPDSAFLLDDSLPTWILGPARSSNFRNTIFINITPENWIPALLQQLYESKRSILLVEGGANTLGQFTDAGLWDEIRVIQNPRRLGAGIGAPVVPAAARLREEFAAGDDTIRIFTR